MICIGLTGGIGSGKSYISDVFQYLRVPVYNADSQARHISENKPSVIKNIVSLFGSEAFVQGKLNSKFIGGMVFDDSMLLQKLNEIIHPEVEADFIKWCSFNEDSYYVIKEAAILFETGSYKRLHSNILVIAPEDQKIQRLIKRDGLDADRIRKRMENQWSDQEKLKYADYVINNDEKTLILPQVVEIHQNILENI